MQGVFSRVVRWWTNGPYSHCEAVFGSDLSIPVLCASSSFLDGGVRLKEILLDPAHWDVLDVPAIDQHNVEAWFRDHLGQKYDVAGLLSVISPVRHDKSKWFCSEAIAAGAGFPEAWRLDPRRFYDVCLFVGGTVIPFQDSVTILTSA